MTKRTDFTLKVLIDITNTRIVNLSMTITNNSPNAYFISADSILANGYIKSFDIEGPSYIPCVRGRVGQNNGNEIIELKSGESKISSIQLSNFCSFSHAAPGEYKIKFHDGYHLYTNENKYKYYEKVYYGDEFVHLIAQSTFIIGENPEDLALKSLSYESGL